MTPHAVVVSLLIDLIVAGRRSRFPAYCAALVACTLWRWVWLGRLQYGVQCDLHGVRGVGFWSRLVPLLHVRLLSNTAITWGSALAVVPAFYGLYAGSFAAPLLVESDDPPGSRVRLAIGWIHHAGRRLWRVTSVVAVLAVVLTVGLFVSQAVLANTVLPTFLGVDTADLNVTFDSWPWRLRILYVVFLLLDAFWTVAAVFLYYDTQSRRMATDLRVRLRRIAGEQA